MKAGVMEMQINVSPGSELHSPDIESLLMGVAEVTEEQLGMKFDELSEIVANQPDNELAYAAVKNLVVEARDSGYVDRAMQMAMTLGAMACMHNHMQGLANEVGSMFDDAFSSHGKDDEHNHVSEKDSHDAKSCADCKAGRTCRKK